MLWLKLRYISLVIHATLPLTLVLPLFTGCSQQNTAPVTPAPEVHVAVITLRDIPIVFELLGQAQSSRQINIQARVNGFLERRLYTEGSLVKPGQVLFLMEQQPFIAQLNQAKAALAQQQAVLETARATLARIKPLAELNALSQQDLDNATGQFRSAQAAVDQAQAQVDLAEINLSYTKIVAPVAGITGSALQAEGSYISTQNNQLTTVSVLSPMWVNFNVSESDFLALRGNVDQGILAVPAKRAYEIELVLSDGRILPHPGSISFADPSYNSQTGTFLVRTVVDNPQGTLRPNQFVQVRIKGALRPNAIALPQRAVHYSARGHSVWVVSANKRIEDRPVVVGPWNKDQWIINQGLKAGELVVVEWSGLVQPGQVVKPIFVKAATASSIGLK